jgi:hypothetical protein
VIGFIMAVSTMLFSVEDKDAYSMATRWAASGTANDARRARLRPMVVMI